MFFNKNTKIQNTEINQKLKLISSNLNQTPTNIAEKIISENIGNYLDKFSTDINIKTYKNNDTCENNDLLTKYDKLNIMLASTLKKNVKMNIAKGESSHELTFILEDYKLSYISTMLLITVSRNGDLFYPQITGIKNIEFSISDMFSKVWIYTKYYTIRIYFYYDLLLDDIPSLYSNKYIKDDTMPYDLFKNDKLKYNLERYKYYSNILESNIIEEQLFSDKNCIKVYLLHVLCDNSGEICLIENNGGNTGNLYYHINSNNDILIEDIQNNSSINRGIGTEMINMLTNFAKKKDIKIIRGNLSIVDIDHRERQIHFYIKNGFDINDDIIKKYITCY